MKIQKYKDKKLKGDYWRFDVTIAGQRYRHGGFATKEEAQNALAGLRLICQKLRYGLPVAESFIPLCELEEKLKNDPLVPYRVKWAMGLFVAQMGTQTSIQKICRADIKTFTDSLRVQRNLTDASYVLYVSALRAALNRAGDYFASLETWRPPKFPKFPKPSKRKRTVSREEFSAMLRALLSGKWKYDQPGTPQQRVDMADIMRLMLLTGARREEIEKLELRSINEAEMEATFTSGKTEKSHTLPISQSTLRILKSRTPLKSGKLFKRPLLTATISRTMQRAAKMANTKFGQRDAWSLHDLRRTASVIMENAGIPYSSVQEILGHERADMTANYTPAQKETMRQAMQILENWCRDIDGFFFVAGALQSHPATSEKSAAA